MRPVRSKPGAKRQSRRDNPEALSVLSNGTLTTVCPSRCDRLPTGQLLPPRWKGGCITLRCARGERTAECKGEKGIRRILCIRASRGRRHPKQTTMDSCQAPGTSHRRQWCGVPVIDAHLRAKTGPTPSRPNSPITSTPMCCAPPPRPCETHTRVSG